MIFYLWPDQQHQRALRGNMETYLAAPFSLLAAPGKVKVKQIKVKQVKVKDDNLFGCTISSVGNQKKAKGEKEKKKKVKGKQVKLKKVKVKHENLLGCTISTAGHPRDELNRLDGLVYQIS